jgi:hypothetical protein
MEIFINKEKGYSYNLTYAFGGLIGTILLGLILDVYNEIFTLRISIVSIISLSISYILAIFKDSFSDYVFLFFTGVF